MSMPLTIHFTTELAFWLLAGFFICEFLFALRPTSHRFDPRQFREWCDYLAIGSLHGAWILLATGRVELAIAELACYLLTSAWHCSSELKVGIHLARRVLWFAAVIWWWPR